MNRQYKETFLYFSGVASRLTHFSLSFTGNVITVATLTTTTTTTPTTTTTTATTAAAAAATTTTTITTAAATNHSSCRGQIPFSKNKT